MDGKMNRRGSTIALIVLVLFAISVVIYVFRDSSGQDGVAEEAATPPSTEWTTKPEGGIEVDLPDTPMRNVRPGEPAEGPDEEAGSE